MTGFFVFLVIFSGVVAFSRWRNRDPLLLAAAAHQLPAGISHLRSGQSPSFCSWCKITTLARKLFVFERREGQWRAADVMARLTICPPDEVAGVASVLTHDYPHWRRFCSEKCTREFLAVEHAPMQAPFSSCAYCAMRIPSELQRCNHCGATVMMR
jgi:hypothetical protein